VFSKVQGKAALRGCLFFVLNLINQTFFGFFRKKVCAGKTFVYISAMNNAQTHTAMKIQVKDVKVGMNVNFGAPGEVVKLENITYKNGNPAIIVTISTHYHVRRANWGGRLVIPAGCMDKKTMKPESYIKLIDA